MVASNGRPFRARSAGNSSTTPLAAGATFTGAWEQNDEPDVMVSCYSDTDATLYFDFSNDGEMARTFPPAGFSVTGGVHEFHTALKGPRSFRARLVNSAGAPQTEFDLSTYFGRFRQDNAPLNLSIANDADAIITRAISTEIDLALGRVGGMLSDARFGYLIDQGTSIDLGTPSTWVDLWSFGGQRATPLHGNTFTPYMASTASGDTDIPVTWTYLDADGVEREVTVNTDASDGQTPVSIGVTAQELYRGTIEGDTDQTGNIAAGTASGSFSGGAPSQATALAQIPVNDNQSQMLISRVPAGKVRILDWVRIPIARASGADGSAHVVLQTREPGGVWKTRRPFLATTAVPVDRKIRGITLPELTDFRLRIRDVSDAATTIGGELDYYDVDT